jgi:hypothetical protein
MIIDVILLGWTVDAPVATALDVVLGVGGVSGDPASQSLGFAWVGAFTSSEALGGTAVSGAATFVPASCLVYCDTAPTSNATFAITKNGSAWGSVTILAGQTEGSATIASPSVVDGDLLRFTAPAVVDATLSGLYVTLASAS